MNVMAVHRPYWKCLQNLNDDDSMKLEDYLAEWEKNHRQGVDFYNNENPPEKFDLTGFYPLYTDAENIRLDKEIDELILATDLVVPKHKTGICFNANEKEFFCAENLGAGSLLTPDERSPKIGTVIEAICKREV